MFYSAIGLIFELKTENLDRIQQALSNASILSAIRPNFHTHFLEILRYGISLIIENFDIFRL